MVKQISSNKQIAGPRHTGKIICRSAISDSLISTDLDHNYIIVKGSKFHWNVNKLSAEDIHQNTAIQSRTIILNSSTTTNIIFKVNILLYKATI